MAYAENADDQATQALAAFATMPSISHNILPKSNYFKIITGRNIIHRRIKDAAEQHLLPFGSSPEPGLICRRWETASELNDRRYRTFKTNQANFVERFAFWIQKQWICEVPQAPSGDDFGTYIDVLSTIEELQPEWLQWYQNHQFYKYLCKIASDLQRYPIRSISMSHQHNHKGPVPQIPPRRRPFIDDQDLFRLSIPSLPELQDTASELHHAITCREASVDKISALMDRLEQQASQEYERNYVRDLRRSLASLNSRSLHFLHQNLSRCHSNVKKIYRSLENAAGFDCNLFDSISAQSPCCSELVAMKFMAPRISQSFFLRQLSRNCWQRLSIEWKRAVVAYGVALTQLQRANRLIKASANESDLLKELLNVGHSNWEPLDYPETLLLEVESGIMIREVQEEIASQMRKPPSQANSVMQLTWAKANHRSSYLALLHSWRMAQGSSEW